MMIKRVKFVIGIFFILGVLVGGESLSFSNGKRPIIESGIESKRIFLYTAKKLGVSLLRASITIENGPTDQGKPLYQIDANIESLDYLKFLFRMNNRFSSTVEATTCSPVRYVKRIDQQGLLTQKKNYLQILTFDFSNQKVVSEKGGEKEKQEFVLLPGTLDPLSMFAKYYLKEELHPGQNIHVSLFDGVKMRQMIFYSKKGLVKSKLFGEVEAVCLESSTSLSTFGDKEGNIRIWYIANEEKTPILIELDLPIGDIKFELESMERS